MQQPEPLTVEPQLESPVEPPSPLANDLPFAEAITAIQPAPAPQRILTEPATTPAPSPVLTTIRHGLWGYLLPLLFFVAVIVLVVYAAPYFIVHWRNAETQADAEAAYQKRRAELRAEAEHAEKQLDMLDKRVQLVSLGFREIVRKVTPKVVNVANYREPRKGEVLPKRALFYDPEKDRRYIQASVGSGIILQPGYIVTNHHVVRNAQRLRVQFASGQSVGIDPEAVAADSITDLAVIKLPDQLPAGLKEDAGATVDLADSDKDVQVGDFALAIGSPLGLRQTVTQGVVSAKGRLLNLDVVNGARLELIELLQTDAAINPGNSGGPLFDHLGRLIGINVAIASDNGGNQGIGFAIPSNTVKKIVARLIAQGEVPRGYLGIALEELGGPQAKALGLVDQGGVVITSVMPGEAAAKAGLREKDVIVKFNNEPLQPWHPVRHLRQLIVDTDPDGEITLEIMRDAQRQNVSVKVGKRPPNLP